MANPPQSFINLIRPMAEEVLRKIIARSVEFYSTAYCFPDANTLTLWFDSKENAIAFGAVYLASMSVTEIPPTEVTKTQKT